VEFDTSWKTLNSGLMCPDKIWRQIVTLQDAVDNGWDLTDIDEIREKTARKSTTTSTPAPSSRTVKPPLTTTCC
jgi:hypothetical protein